ncbi:MAG: HAMP domain-containing sensor histidine kinase [Crocinitomicaceae bacterium]|nr:HAMP domain-containing sensor histidine kinase [Crocinitomicaceae bacterium]
MKKIRVNFILVLVIAALLALLIIQAFQTTQLFGIKTDEFADRFKTTLDRIALRHEKAEDIRQYMILANNDFSGQYQDVLKEEFQNLLSAQESISIQDTSIYENGKMENYLIIKGETYDSISGLTAEHSVLARDVRHIKELFQGGTASLNQDSLQLAIQLDQRVIQEIFKKAQFVNQMMINAFRNNVYQKPSDRLDIVFLDSVLHHELMADEFPAKYEFVVTDAYNQIIEFDRAPDNYNLSIDTAKSHVTLLFPSNPVDEDLYLHLKFPEQSSFLLTEMWGPLTVNLLLVILIIVAMIFMFRTILTQKKFSEMKNDFISNMTHEFRTPISTISLACEAMNDTDMVSKQEDAVQPYIKMINEENKRLSLLVERILQSATLDKGELRLVPSKLLLNEIIYEVVERAQFRIAGTEGSVELNCTSELLHVQGDKMHVTNTISNLIDNAIKYSDSNPKVQVSLQKEDGKIILIVADSGIGIKKEHQNKIFDKLYRVPTGNIHNVKGFGLGLSYVKAIVELHGWDIIVKSKIDQGSEFTIIINE